MMGTMCTSRRCPVTRVRLTRTFIPHSITGLSLIAPPAQDAGTRRPIRSERPHSGNTTKTRSLAEYPFLRAVTIAYSPPAGGAVVTRFLTPALGERSTL
jgi:hypothetical protein